MQEAYPATGRLATAGRLAQNTDLVANLPRAALNRARSEIRRRTRADRRLLIRAHKAPRATATADFLAGQDFLRHGDPRDPGHEAARLPDRACPQHARRPARPAGSGDTLADLFD